MRNLYTVLGRTAHETKESVQKYGSSFGKVAIAFLILITIFQNQNVYGQCTNTFATMLPATVQNPGTTITTNTGKYFAVNVTAGTVYKITSSLGGSAFNIRMGTATGAVVWTGVSGSDFTAPSTGVAYVHHSTSACATTTNTTNRTITFVAQACNTSFVSPWTEGFESLGATSTSTGNALLPCGWDKTHGDWVNFNAGSTTYNDPKTGTYYLANVYSATNETVFTRGFSLTAGTTYDFSFWFAGDGIAGWTGDVVYNTQQTVAGSTNLGASFATSATVYSSTYQNVTRSFTPTTSGVYYFGVKISATSAPWYIGFDDFSLITNVACTGTPNAGVAALSSSSGCLGATVNVSATGITTGSGITYQWQSSTNGTTWSNIVGATSSTYTATPSVTTYYRLVTTCTNSGLTNTSSSIMYTVNCYQMGASGASITACSGTLYDNGGAADYGNSLNSTITIYPATAGNMVNLNFSAFATENNWDGLVIYNGNSTAAPIISSGLAAGTGSATNCPAGSYYGTVSPGTVTSTAADGSLTLQFRSDGSGVAAGFVASISCTPPPACSAPTSLASGSITGTSATISWTAASPAPASGYQYYVSTSSTAPTAGTTPTGTTAAGVTSATVTGLTGVTTYYFWVRSNCGGTGTSSWSASATFTTTCGLNTVVLNMSDSWGDGWNGATYTLVNNTTSATVATGTLSTGSTGSTTFCLANGCYQFTTTDDIFDEMSWAISVNGTATASGIDNASEVLSINSVCGVPGCMDPASDNYNPAATVDNGSCVYLCASAVALTCGTATNYTNAAGTGAWNSLGGPYSTPGTEQLFTYTPTTTGNYTISVTSNGWNDLHYSTSCGSTGWTYVDDITGSANNILTLTGGTTYYFLLDPEGTAGVTGTITASCYTPPAWTDAWVSMNTGSSTWCAGETRTISVTVTNTGSSTWTNATPDINIGVKWNADADYFIRTDANGLASGATQTYNLTVTAPLTAGSNNLSFDIVNENNFWFANNTNGGGPGNVVYVSPAITIVASPTMNAGADQTVCEAASVTLTDAGSGATSLSWNNGITNGVAFIAPSSTTTYTVTGTNAAGCTSTDQVVVTVKSLPVVNAGVDQTVCQGVTANLSGSVTGGSCIMSLTTSGGSWTSEKWVNITTAANGAGTVVWAQGNGTIGNASGLLTNQAINLSAYIGQTLYLNTYDMYDDSWDGSVYNLSFNGSTVINNGGNSPSDGTDTDALSTWESIAAEMETSEAFTVPALTYAWTSSPAGFTSSALTATVNPTQTTTYTLSSTYNGCTGSDAVVVTLPTAGTALSQNNENATCTVNQNGWVHFYHSSGRLIGSINSQGQNLGAVTVTSYVDPTNALVPACTNPNPIYSTSVMQRHWVITPTHQPTTAVLVRFPYSNAEFSGLSSAASTNANSNDDLLTPADLGMTKYSNGTAANVNADATDNCGVGTSTFHTQMGNGLATSYSAVSANYVDFSIPGFSEFWLHGSTMSSPLPVELVNFQANCAGEGKVDVTWATASEHNSANFTVEKSRDGINWTVLSSVAGAGNSTQMINYAIVDNNAASGVNYYRLTQTDFDGASETFNIASANCGDNTPLTTVKVYPNPSAGDFYIDFTSEEITGASVITITDARGMAVYTQNVTVTKGSNVFHIENMEAAPGMYYIQVSNGTATSNIVKHSLR